MWKVMKQHNCSLSFSTGFYQSTTMATHFFFSGMRLVFRDVLYSSTLWEYSFLFLGLVVRYSFLFIGKCMEFVYNFRLWCGGLRENFSQLVVEWKSNSCNTNPNETAFPAQRFTFCPNDPKYSTFFHDIKLITAPKTQIFHVNLCISQV